MSGLFLKLRNRAIKPMQNMKISQKSPVESCAMERSPETGKNKKMHPYEEYLKTFLTSSDDQRDFREFLEIIGLPDLITYVDFIIQVEVFKNCETAEDSRNQGFVIYRRFIRNYSNEKLTLEWPIKIRIEKKIQTKCFDRSIFDIAMEKSLEKLAKCMSHFYKTRNSRYR